MPKCQIKFEKMVKCIQAFLNDGARSVLATHKIRSKIKRCVLLKVTQPNVTHRAVESVNKVLTPDKCKFVVNDIEYLRTCLLNILCSFSHRSSSTFRSEIKENGMLFWRVHFFKAS